MKSLGYAYAEYLQDENDPQIDVDQYFEDIIHGEVEIPKWFVEQWLVANPIFASEEFSAEEGYEVIMVNVNHSMERDGETFVFGDVMFGLPNNGRSRISSYGQGPDKPSARQSLIERAIEHLHRDERMSAKMQQQDFVYQAEAKKNAEYDEEDMVYCNHCSDIVGNEKEVYGDETVEYEMANGELVCIPCYKIWMKEYKNDLDPHYTPFYAETFEADPEYEGLNHHGDLPYKVMDKIYKDARKEREYNMNHPKDGSKVPLSRRKDWELIESDTVDDGGDLLIVEALYEDKSSRNKFYGLTFYFDLTNYTSPFKINPNDKNDYRWDYWKNFNFDPVNPRGYASLIISGGKDEGRIISSHPFKEMNAETFDAEHRILSYVDGHAITILMTDDEATIDNAKEIIDNLVDENGFDEYAEVGEGDKEITIYFEDVGGNTLRTLSYDVKGNKANDAIIEWFHGYDYPVGGYTANAETFEADTATDFYRNCNQKGWSVLGRTMHYGCSVFGKVVGGGVVVANSLNFYDKGGRVLRTAGTNNNFPPALELAKVSRELQPDSIGDWSRVAQVTNDRLSQNFSAETKSWRIQNRDSSGKFTKGFVEEIDIADFMELEPESIPEISVEMTYTPEQTVDFVNSMINDDDLPTRLIDSSFVNTLQSHVSSADLEMLQALNDAANMAAFEALMDGSAENQQSASRAVFVTDMLMNYKWGQDYWASEWE